MAAKKAQRVIGIEYVKDAVENAKRNAQANGITNAEFFAADAADGLYRAARMDKVDILLADPPRSGMDDNMLEAILRVQPEKIIYVSCNPATLAKNIKVLKEKYLVETVMPFDLFPNTPHIESITVLQKAKA
jgi:23S rRNA (uracil1939-C5)-methyltransferase